MFEKFQIPMLDSDVTFEIALHQGNSNHLVIIIPGADGDKTGYKDKYVQMANKIVDKHKAFVIRFSNRREIGLGWTTRFESLMSYLDTQGYVLNGIQIDRITLVGYSVGGGIITLLAPAYPRVKDIILLSPVLLERKGQKIHELGEYEGYISILYGSRDSICDADLIKKIIENNKSIKIKDFTGIDQGHIFKDKEAFDLFIEYPSMKV